jgi:hypothetical protein
MFSRFRKFPGHDGDGDGEKVVGVMSTTTTIAIHHSHP